MQDVGERIALGFVEAERQRRANVPGAEVFKIDGLLLAFANVPDPPVNSVLVITEPSDPPAALAAAEAEFRARDRAFGMDAAVYLWVEPNSGHYALTGVDELTFIAKQFGIRTLEPLLPGQRH